MQPSLVVCPATVVAHWVRELTTWHPQLRVFTMHAASRTITSGSATSSQIVRAAVAGGAGHVLVTTYEGLRVHRQLLVSQRWGYVVLDEGHKIKNPDAGVTVIAKQLHTVHRLVLSGAPIQNKLAELWSIFDFVLPSRLGDLSVFEANFAHPISAGGWTHATPLQVATAHQTALVLRDTIGPYLLRRLKRDVNAHLPSKTEQVGRGGARAHCHAIPAPWLHRCFFAGSRRLSARRICASSNLTKSPTFSNLEPPRSGPSRSSVRGSGWPLSLFMLLRAPSPS